MVSFDVNYVGILVAAIASMVIGMVWYGPLFGKTWMKMNNLKESDMNKMKKKGMTGTYIASFAGSLVMAFVLVNVIMFAKAADAMTGALVGFMLWLGFIATTSMMPVLWQGKSMEAYLLDNGHMLLVMLAMGAILAVWV